MKQAQFGLYLIVLVFISCILQQCKPDQVTATKPTEELTVQPAMSRPIDSVRVISNSEEVTISLFEEAAPSVVYITTTTVRQDYWSTNLYEIPAGTGSGFIWDEE